MNKYTKGQITKRNQPKLTSGERVIIEAPVPSLIQEFKKIRNKKSFLTKHLRDIVEMRIKFLIEKGFLKSEEEILLCEHPFYDFKKCDFIIEGQNCSECQFINIEFKN